MLLPVPLVFPLSPPVPVPLPAPEPLPPLALELLPLLLLPLELPPPTGAAPPLADETGIVVVVVVPVVPVLAGGVGVVVVVVVTVAGAPPVPSVAGAEVLTPIKVRAAAGAESPLCTGLPATRALAEGVGALPPEICAPPVD